MQPLDASSVFATNDTVFWVGATGYEYIASVSNQWAAGRSIYVPNVKACR